MLQTHRIFERELRFTRAYRANQDEDRSLREYRCLKEQLPYMFVTPQSDDIIAGRIDRPLIGFFPIFEGDSVDKVAYCIDEAGCFEALARMQADPSYTPEEVAQAREMIAFWQQENTNTKIRARMPEKWRHAMGPDNYIKYSGAIHPLYRIASANLDMKKLFAYGLPGLIAHVKTLESQAEKDSVRHYYRATAGVLELIREVLSLYAGEAARLRQQAPDGERRRQLKLMEESLLRVRDGKPETLQDAIQLQNVYMLAGRTTEMGRLDDYLCEFYRRDRERGVLTREEAIRLIDNFFTITEQERGRDTRAIIGGFGREHPQSADEFDLLILDVLEGRPYHFYPQVSLRYHKGMDSRVYDRSLELLGKGYTFPLLYNDDVNVPSVMRAMDVPRKVAEQYSFFGCGEYTLTTMSIGTPNTAINMAKVLELALHNGIDPESGQRWGLETGEITDDLSFEELMDRYKRQADFFADISGDFEELVYDICREECSFLLMSALYHDCLGRGKALLDGGIFHLGGTVETYGNVTTIDSLAAIREVVYQRRAMTLTHLVKALDANFEGYENERHLLRRAGKFGNDYEDVDQIAMEVHEHICHAVRNQRLRTRLDSFLVVIINNSMNTVLGNYVGATADGRGAGESLSNGNSANNGADREGITALIRSLTKMDTSIHAGGNQNLKFSTKMFRENAAEARALIDSFFQLGGQQLNLSVLNQAELIDAMKHPEKHENLVVRVGGFTARFIHLDPKTQQDVLMRTAY